MNLLSSTSELLEFHLDHWESLLLVAILGRYPCLPPAHQPLSKGGAVPDTEADQLLQEALAEKRQENKKALQKLLADPQRFRETDDGWRLSLSPGDAEWLLQAMNDIRVGCWVKIGSPADPYQGLNKKAAREVELMEMSGYFQMQLLAGLDSSIPPPKL